MSRRDPQTAEERSIVLLARRVPRTAEERRELFPTALIGDRLIVAFLWRPDGSQASSISIDKEIWFNFDGKGDDLGDGLKYPVFHVFNHLDPSKAHSSDSGYRVNPLEEPFTKFEDALRLAQQHAEEALASGEWVPIERVGR